MPHSWRLFRNSQAKRKTFLLLTEGNCRGLKTPTFSSEREPVFVIFVKATGSGRIVAELKESARKRYERSRATKRWQPLKNLVTNRPSLLDLTGAGLAMFRSF
jgi:hypothetical protein